MYLSIYLPTYLPTMHVYIFLPEVRQMQRFRSQIPRISLLLIWAVMCGVFPKSPPGMISSLEGLTEPTESFHIHGNNLLQGKDID